MDLMTYAHKLARTMGQRRRASGTPFQYQQAFRACLRIANKRLRPTSTPRRPAPFETNTMIKTAWVEQWLDEAAEDLLAGYPVKIDGATVVEPLDFYMALLLAYDAKREADSHFQADREALLLGAVLNNRGDPADGHLFAVMGGRDEVKAIAKDLCESHADKAHTHHLASEEDERGWIEYQRRKDAA